MNKNKISRAIMLGLGLTLAGTTLPSYAAHVPEGTKLAPVQELVRGNGSEIETLDPQKVNGVPGANVDRDLFEGLVNEDGYGKLLPGVADKWETKDNKTFIFHLRKNAQWSNGDPVTADDFVYGWQRLVDPATASPYAEYLQLGNVTNAEDIVAGKKDKSTLGIKALDAHTLEVHLDKPTPYFVKMLVHQSTFPAPRKVIEKWGNKWTRPGHFVGNGAYVLDKWVVNERLVLKRNPLYWNNAETIINKVTYLPIESQNAEMNRFLAGEMDSTYEMPVEHFKRLKKDHPESVSVTGYLCNYYYDFNMRKKPFDDVRVRKALSYAIDRDIITKAIMGQGQKPAYAFTPDITAGFTPPMPEYGKWTQKERDQKARELLAEAGYDKGNPLTLTLIYNTSDNHKKVATAIQSMWKQTLGVKVNLENQEWKTFLDNRRQGNFEVARDAWCGDYNEASTFLSQMLSNNSGNYAHYQSKAYDNVMEKAMVSTSDTERANYYAQAEKLIAQDMPVAPTYQYVKAHLLAPYVGGYPIHNAGDMTYTRDMYIKAK
ncbi:ABC transporter substrate-binding protein [Vibrio gazogenes]|uniref:Oligopeptide transport system substrate-binding protein n=3 Tax=Vibrio gazogenes TaxID=687 RepID=A0A1M4XUC3_VIBGA|nr:ABC transporter substrate-binding protein [Vibrio gazogenes]USP12878.1 ABC transporter substrate-binding protein [Vibrio gazogenes]SHE97081.1 oligopeptide transport system substrate-binding protein [Vibrio gazogenes DSM 21264] [Vibrio gazogenes DSM 21264 = NBRC 103151]